MPSSHSDARVSRPGGRKAQSGAWVGDITKAEAVFYVAGDRGLQG